MIMKTKTLFLTFFLFSFCLGFTQNYIIPSPAELPWERVEGIIDPEIIIKRIKGTDRPLLQCDDPLQKLKDLLEERKGKYGQADLTIEITENMDAEAAADKLVRELHDFIDDNPPAWKLAKAKAQSEGLDWVQ